MKKIVVISDTHIPTIASALPPRIMEMLKDCDLCIHAGDYVDKKVIDTINTYTKLEGVCGNMDSEEVKNMLPEKKIIKIDKVAIGITHGSGSYFNILERIKKQFSSSRIDICIFGHTHKPLNKKEGKIIFFNPGSPTDRIFTPYNSFGIINIEGDKIEAEVIKLG